MYTQWWFKKNRFYTFMAFVFVSCLCTVDSHSKANDISLAQSFLEERLREILIPQNEWRPFPRASERDAWESIPDVVKQAIINQAEEYVGEEITVLPASVYLQFKRNGNRQNYERLWYDRRERLHALVTAECIENKGRFLDSIVDSIWAICEETSWTWPAHIHPQKAGTGLPDVDDQVVALFSAQTSNTLVLTSYLLGEQLDTISPLIRRRIEREVDRRILTPVLTKEFGWMGYAARANQSYPNNWNPWICSNVILSALLNEKDEARRARLVHKALDCLDNFLTYYPSDGSCDEGPSYWGRAGASLFDGLEHLYSATKGKFDLYSHPLIQEIGRFIYRVHIIDEWFVCLGDCDARITNRSNELIYRFGKRIGDNRLMALGAYGIKEETLAEKAKWNFDLNRYLHLVLDGIELVHYNPPSQPLVRDVWLGNPDMQLMAARDKEDSAEGLYLAAWGGHNAQSHNHNDVGNFVLFADGKPILIDIGRPTYTRQTFSSHRYEIWAFQSEYHNLPTINGIEQKNGRRYEAKDVRYTKSDTLAELEMDIAAAYPEQADVESWKRSVRFHWGEEARIVDTFTLKEASRDIIENFIVAGPVIEKGPGTLVLKDREESVSLLMEYDPERLSAAIERIELEDSKLQSVWGTHLNRIQMRAKQERKNDTYEFRFSMEK